MDPTDPTDFTGPSGPSGPDTSELQPLSVARVRRVLATRKIDYVTAESGDTGLENGNETIWIAVGGPAHGVLTVHGDWPGSLPIDRVDDVRAFIADWHRHHYWPTAHFGIADDGAVSVAGHTAYDFEAGVADRQLDDAMAMSIAKLRELFRELSRQLAGQVSGS